MVVRTSENGFVFPLGTKTPYGYLADFDIGGYDLKSDHKEWLEKNIVLREKAKSGAGVNGRWKIELVGRASQSGSNDFNRILSEQRGDEVEKFLSSHIMPHRLEFSRRNLGESIPLNDSEYENEMDRSVRVRAEFLSWGRSKRIEPLIPEIKPWRRTDRKSVDFTIQVLKARVEVNTTGLRPIPLKKGDIQVWLFIEIRELGTHDTSFYEFKGNGPYGHFDKPGGWSRWEGMFQEGNKHRFATEDPMDADDFGGGAHMKVADPDDGSAQNFTFGPSDSFFFPTRVKVGDLTFGRLIGPPPTPRNFLLTGDGLVTGKMKRITQKPDWAR